MKLKAKTYLYVVKNDEDTPWNSSPSVVVLHQTTTTNTPNFTAAREPVFFNLILSKVEAFLSAMGKEEEDGLTLALSTLQRIMIIGWQGLICPHIGPMGRCHVIRDHCEIKIFGGKVTYDTWHDTGASQGVN